MNIHSTKSPPRLGAFLFCGGHFFFQSLCKLSHSIRVLYARYYKINIFLLFYLQDIENFCTFAKTIIMWTELSDPAILKKFGLRLRDYRMRMELTQTELAEKSKVSLGSVVRLEKGLPVSTILLVSILRTLGMLENMEVLIPELDISPMQMRKMQGKKKQRIRHKKER